MSRFQIMDDITIFLTLVMPGAILLTVAICWIRRLIRRRNSRAARNRKLRRTTK